MGELNRHREKPLEINPIRLSQPMGAALAFLGVDRCMPLMHGGMGCTSFTKVFFTRHFCEPIAIQTTAVTDVAAVLDGGDGSIVEAVHNITRKVTPSLIGLHSTGITETKGDDIRGAAKQIKFPIVHVHTADFEGGLESGWGKTVTAMIEQLVEDRSEIRSDKVVLLPHISMQPIEVEKLKEFIGSFGLQVVALPDLSTALDGHLGHKQGALSSGGVTVDEIFSLAEAGAVISVGESVKFSAAALLKKNPAMRHMHLDHVQGLVATDNLVEKLMDYAGLQQPSPTVVRWRKRLQDVMLDSHFALGQTRIMVTGEPDFLAGACQSLTEAGACIGLVLSSVDSPQLGRIEAERVVVGDLEDAEKLQSEYDLIIGNFHAEALARRYGKALVPRGFPCWEMIGNQLKNDLLYEGGAYFLCEAANAAEAMRMQHHAV
ncbi:nitrogenase iron-molybdenum cofactor biosynthesis protein NifN [Syntrophotalea acetylenica]|uniref:nitrogenase iron-molybdenum cofactor biosynthesis protein NifN n=1 Tax=Syntrophotalea acetylenica TaxID=29542 RepID=UPI002A35EF00|nr:nitrogenase iron-molybdenum cofactor biosynthesis protein NifN [Syntrophotalea acetylenica]MDY0263527.1 nitrogenase iron-molybdenum cofactor biosynthesis protein NifN [Syntrophotalea acetylenica]